jgi:hypothetical protein
MGSSVQIAFERCAAGVSAWTNNLTAVTVRFHAIALAAGMWIAALSVLSTSGSFDRHGILKGIDFLQFYTAGRMVAEGRAGQLYDWQVFAYELQHAVPGTGDALFLSVYPPQLALAFAPLGALGYLPALALWTVVSAALYAACVRVLMRASSVFSAHPVDWWLVAVAYAPVQQLLLHGQIGALVLACVTCAWLALRRGSHWWLGAALGCLAFKPPFAIMVVLAILVTRDYRVALGAAASAAVQAAVTAWWLGPDVLRAYVAKVPAILHSAALFEPKPWQMHNLKGFWTLLLGSGPFGTAALAVSSIAVAYAVFRTWRATRAADPRVASLVLGSVLINPHLYVYDLVVLAVPLALTAAWAIPSRRRREASLALVLVHALCWLPLLGPIAAFTHVQLTVPCIAMLLWIVHRAAQSPTDATSHLRQEAEPSARPVLA